MSQRCLCNHKNTRAWSDHQGNFASCPCNSCGFCRFIRLMTHLYHGQGREFPMPASHFLDTSWVSVLQLNSTLTPMGHKKIIEDSTG